MGLCIAHQLLQHTRLSVALVDRQQPCAGATGAGQGYIWMAHRSPDSPLWELAARSQESWERFVRENPELAATMEWQVRLRGLYLLFCCALADLDGHGGVKRRHTRTRRPTPPLPVHTHPLARLQTTGSLLLATTASEMVQLDARAAMLQAKGVGGVRVLTRDQAACEEPALGLPQSAAGLLVESDAQIVSGPGWGGACCVLCEMAVEARGSGCVRTLVWGKGPPA